MPTPQQLRSRLLKKLEELFQLDQPDLDFGFYRIMHAKSVQVREFIEKDLLKIVVDAFGEVDEARSASLKAEYEKAIETARDFGAPEPEKAPKVQEAKARWDSTRETAASESDIYDHLYRFFERYYDGGDFMSRRYYARETPGKAAPYAIPYNGEEVKLHWANADQYYIKTAEYFSNFTFDLTQAAEIRALSHEERVLYQVPDHPVKVHFRIADASEGEHGNVKASDANKRYFIIHKDRPVEATEAGELAIYFEYRPDPEKTGQEKTWREKRNGEAVKAVLEALESDPLIARKNTEEYRRLLTFPAPTEKNKNRPLLAKYINRYTARNTMDYFIHKDLGTFLRRELDFYIKNEVMRLDDIENADVPVVETWLSKVRVLRKIAGKLIGFLAQLEDFQKKLWLKKKFVVETHYCITLDRVPEELYPEIADNEDQRDEWVRLFAIEEIRMDLAGAVDYTEPLTAKFLKANPFLVLDTKFFDQAFKDRLLASLENVEERCNGVLFHSENFQAIQLMVNRYCQDIECIYIDPPYNTDASPILYKNGYRASSWASMMEDRLMECHRLLKRNGVLAVAIDDAQHKELSFLLSGTFNGNVLGTICVRSNPSGRPMQTGYAVSHEYVLFAGNSRESIISRMPPTPKQLARFSEHDEEGRFEWRNLRREGSNSDRAARPHLYYPIYLGPEGIRIPKMDWGEDNEEWIVKEEAAPKEWAVYPDNGQGQQKTWRWGHKKVSTNLPQLAIRKDQTGNDYVYYKRRPNKAGVVSVSSWFDAKYSATEHGTALLKDLFGVSPFSYPKSLFATRDSIYIGNASGDNSTILDFFAGSGTTAHAVIHLNREGGKRKYVLVEMGGYFDTVLLPRIKKVIYSENWKKGKPVSREGVSHMLKYIRLESYEDTLNNLRFDDSPARDKVVNSNPSFKEDYMLHYLLDVETRGSQSLLNIGAFADPTAYTLKVKKTGSDEYTAQNVDLLETFNYFIGLRVIHTAEPQTFTAKFKRDHDPEAPENQETKLSIDGKLRQTINEPSSVDNPVWWFRKVEGWVPGDPSNPDNGKRENVLIVWRKLTGNPEKDNAVLDEWFRKNRISPRNFEFDIIYVNGSNNLPNLRLDTENWKVRLTEEEFMKRMWDVEGV